MHIHCRRWWWAQESRTTVTGQCVEAAWIFMQVLAAVCQLCYKTLRTSGPQCYTQDSASHEQISKYQSLLSRVQRSYHSSQLIWTKCDVMWPSLPCLQPIKHCLTYFFLICHTHSKLGHFVAHTQCAEMRWVIVELPVSAAIDLLTYTISCVTLTLTLSPWHQRMLRASIEYISTIFNIDSSSDFLVGVRTDRHTNYQYHWSPNAHVGYGHHT